LAQVSRDAADTAEVARSVSQSQGVRRDWLVTDAGPSPQPGVDALTSRDAVANARDLAALARDQAATLRDLELTARDAAWASNGHAVTGAEVLLRAGDHRRLAAADRLEALAARTRAAADREEAARDRQQAAADREQAASDRADARAERDLLLQQLALARAAQPAATRSDIQELGPDVVRGHQTTELLLTASVDVVALNGVGGAHAEKGELLAHAERAINERLRSYALIVGVGGEELLCVMCDATVSPARGRFVAGHTALTADP
jgi:hypothetical protein